MRFVTCHCIPEVLRAKELQDNYDFKIIVVECSWFYLFIRLWFQSAHLSREFSHLWPSIWFTLVCKNCSAQILAIFAICSVLRHWFFSHLNLFAIWPSRFVYLTISYYFTDFSLSASNYRLWKEPYYAKHRSRAVRRAQNFLLCNYFARFNCSRPLKWVVFWNQY